MVVIKGYASNGQKRVNGAKRRRSIRLQGFDYSQPGAYFVTVCSAGRKPIFGAIADGRMRLNAFGEIVSREWLRSGELRPALELDLFVVMPNHLHGIVVIVEEEVGAHSCAPLRSGIALRRKRALASFVAQFKASAATRVNELRRSPGAPVWQRNYYEHIIRNEADLNRIREYVITNPAKWSEDEYYRP